MQSPPNPRDEPRKESHVSASVDTTQPPLKHTLISLTTLLSKHQSESTKSKQCKDNYLKHWKEETKTQGRLTCFI